MTLQRKLQVLGLLLILTIGVGLRACYWTGKADEAIHQNPPVTKREVAKIKAQVNDLKKKAATAVHNEDSIKVVAEVHQRRADKSQHQVDSLTRIYEEVPAAAARVTDDELYRHLATYRPAPFPDTTGN